MKRRLWLCTCMIPVTTIFPYNIVALANTRSTYVAVDISVNGHGVSNPMGLVAEDPSTGQDTTFVPIWYVMNALDEIGIKSTWNGEVWSLRSPGVIQPLTAQFNTPKSGTFLIDIGNEMIQAVPGIVASDTNSNQGTSYMPLWYVMQNIRKLGLQSTWDGVHWNLSSSGQSTSSGSPVPVNPSSISLTLTNTLPPGINVPSVPVVPGTTSLTLPLYPGSTESTQSYNMPFEQTPLTPYLRTAVAEYLVPGKLLDVARWYQQVFASNGYKQSGIGSKENVKTGVHTDGIVFAPTNQQSGHDVAVDMSFQQASDGETLVEYYATDVVIPPRPTSSYLPNDITSIDVTMFTYGTSVSQRSTTITNITGIADIVNAVNGLNTLLSPNPGGPIISGTATLTFHAADGSTISMTVNDPAKVTIGKIGLIDLTNSVWNAIVTALQLQANS